MSMRENLKSLALLLYEHGDSALAVMVEDAIAGPEHEQQWSLLRDGR